METAGAALVREVGPSDGPALAEVYADAYASAFAELLGPSLANRTALLATGSLLLATMERFDDIGLVVERGSELVGFVRFRQPGPVGELLQLYVAPEHWGDGSADELMRATIERARLRGCLCLALWVAKTNGRARAFYARHGLTATGEVRASSVGGVTVQYLRYTNLLTD